MYNKSIAILFYGQAFRENMYLMNKKRSSNVGCDCRSFDIQFYTLDVNIQNIVKPLQNNSNKIGLFMHESSRKSESCYNLTKRLFRKIYRVHNITFTDTIINNYHPYQKQSFLSALDLMRQYVSNYNYLILSRLDLMWKQNILQWKKVDFTTINLLNMCSLLRPRCVSDWGYILPNSMFMNFSSIMTKCWRNTAGHPCKYHLQNYTNISYLTDWRPNTTNGLKDRKNLNPFVEIMYTFYIETKNRLNISTSCVNKT